MKLQFTVQKLFSFQLIVFLAIMAFSGSGYSQNFGQFASALYLNVNGTGQFYNTSPATLNANSINPASGAAFFTGNLGTFVANSGTLNLKGAEIKTYKNNSGNVCGADIYYRIYRTGDIPPAFVSLGGLAFFNNCTGTAFPDASGGPCGTGDQKWQTVSQSNDLTLRCPGNYNFEIYYTVTGSNSGGGCGETVYDSNNGNNYFTTFTITSDMQVTAASSSPICAGSTLNLAGSVTGGLPGYTWLWNGPMGYSSTAAAPVLAGAAAAASGTYSVAVTDACNVTSSATTSVTVNAVPVTPDGTVTDPTCSDATGAISVNMPSGNFVYSFDNGGTYVSSNSLSGLAPGNYQIKIKDSSTGCESAAKAFDIAQAPNPALASASSNSPQCTANSIQLTAVDAGAGALYSWTGPNGFTTSVQNPQIPYSATAEGTYALTVTNSDGCSATATTEVSCGALPVRLISFSGQAFESAIQLQWEAVDASNFSYFEIERSSNTKSFEAIGSVYYEHQKQSYSLLDSLPLLGMNYYRLKMVDLDGSKGYSKVISLKNTHQTSGYAFLENPSGADQIHLFSNMKPVLIELISESGKVTRLKLVQVNEKEWLIDSKDISDNQLSFLRITTENGLMVRKFIKTK